MITHPFCTRDDWIRSIPAPYNIGKHKIMFVLEDETEMGLDYDKGNPTEGGQSQ